MPIGTKPQALFLLAVPLLSHLVSAALTDGRPHANVMRPPTIPKVPITDDGPVINREGRQLPPYNTTYYFDQLIDHDNPSLGTFKQRFWHSALYYEPGGPIILATPGESNAEGYEAYLTNKTISGRIGATAQQQNGCTIILEHRFYGHSNPYPNLSVRSFRVHTLQQAIEDLVYFAENVNLPMPGGDRVAPGKAPWILLGGSYSGALASWTMVNKPGVFFAGYATSAVVEPILDFWAYFEPIRSNMPQNCSADVQAVIAHVDKIFTSHNQTAIQALKASFGMGSVTHLDDVAGALRNNLWDWQLLQPTTGPNGQFYKFCDALEVRDGVSAPGQGWGLEIALPAWANYFSKTYLPMICQNKRIEDCVGTYNASDPFWLDINIDNDWRSWFWIVCNQVGYLQQGAPVGHPTLVTRVVRLSDELRQCQQMFPEAYPTGPPSVATVKAHIKKTSEDYKGWGVKLDRMFFVNGRRDPWRDATVSSLNRIRESTTRQRIALSNGFHCSDLRISNGEADATIGAIQAEALKYMRTWLNTWEPSQVPAEVSTGILKNLTGVAKVVAPSVVTSKVDKKPINAFMKGVGF